MLPIPRVHMLTCMHVCVGLRCACVYKPRDMTCVPVWVRLGGSGPAALWLEMLREQVWGQMWSRVWLGAWC